jgi:thiamine-phosphate pyrophosphorylase
MVAPGTERRGLSAPEAAGPLRRERLAGARLYFVCEALPYGGDPEPLLNAALGGGAQIVQLRDKDADDRQILRSADTFSRVAGINGALFIVNDRPDLAQAAGADGVHLGQEDADPAEAREILGPDAIIGLSTHTTEQVEAALEAGIADYISVGPVWETPTKEGRPAAGLELVEHAAANATVPFFAIGGIDPGNVGEVIAAGASRIAVVRAIRDHDDPRAAAGQLRRLVGERGE